MEQKSATFQQKSSSKSRWSSGSNTSNLSGVRRGVAQKGGRNGNYTRNTSGGRGAGPSRSISRMSSGFNLPRPHGVESFKSSPLPPRTHLLLYNVLNSPISVLILLFTTVFLVYAPTVVFMNAYEQGAGVPGWADGIAYGTVAIIILEFILRLLVEVSRSDVCIVASFRSTSLRSQFDCSGNHSTSRL